jgi:predicted RNA-binding protein with PUA-like domain
MAYWLLKTEPETFGIETLAALPRRTTCWDGVRNYQARNFLRDDMERGDEAFLYHSSCAVPGIVGLLRVVRAGYPDHTAFDRRHPHYDAASTPEKAKAYFLIPMKSMSVFLMSSIMAACFPCLPSKCSAPASAAWR